MSIKERLLEIPSHARKGQGDETTMNTQEQDGHEAQCAAQEAMFAEEGKRYCQKCGAELRADEEYLCKNCDLAGMDEEE